LTRWRDWLYFLNQRQVTEQGYEAYRQIISRRYRAIYPRLART